MEFAPWSFLLTPQNNTVHPTFFAVEHAFPAALPDFTIVYIASHPDGNPKDGYVRLITMQAYKEESIITCLVGTIMATGVDGAIRDDDWQSFLTTSLSISITSNESKRVQQTWYKKIKKALRALGYEEAINNTAARKRKKDR
jgi:hypothetical protein